MSNPTSSTHRIVILGGGYAGLTVAQRLSKKSKGMSITLIDAKPEFQERIRLHQIAAGQPGQSFQFRTFLSPLGVAFVQAQVIALDPTASNLTVQRADGITTTLDYDYLVYALGSTMDVDQVPGVRQHAHALQSVQAAKDVYHALRQSGAARVLVVGAGLTGIETAAELAESLPHVNVTLATGKPFSSAAVPGGYDKKATDYLYRAFEQRNIALRSGARVKALRHSIAEMSDGQEMGFDVCIWTSGFVPIGVARDAGIHVNARGQIVTDAALRSLSHPNIIAIGDAAQSSPDATGPLRMGSATALAMAPAGARTVLALVTGKEPPPFRFVYLFRNICLGRHDGVVQFVDRHDAPRNIVWTGAAAARWKEYVCTTTLSTIGLTPEKIPPAVPPLRTLPQLMQGLQQYA